MTRFRLSALSGAALSLLVILASVLPASADNFANKITVNVAPVYLFGTNADLNAPPPPGTTTALGYTTDHPVPDTVRVDYGIDFKLGNNVHLSYAHGNVAYGLGRILTLAPSTSFVSGTLNDYTDSIALTATVAKGLAVQGTYFNHQRTDATGLCLNQKYCPSPVNGLNFSNPSSIDEMGYTLGFVYDFGPTTKIGPLFTAAAAAKYVPRPGVPNDPATVALGGLGSYIGSQTLFPYSMTMKLPILPSSTFTPFINWTNLPVLYRDSAVPEEYRGFVWGISKVISKNVTISYTNLNLQSCRCVARVPPPDNLRLAFGILKLDFHTPL
ncbi:MAG TPA: hypothetical protein VMA36_16380 [Candidatus Limnocylindria bacterium]|jgi:hypothetical protein|nr:hypothetical protein [Candidatus Limnocylindria bacterium]